MEKKKVPGIQCLRMCVIFQEFWETVYYLPTAVWCKRAVTYFLSIDAHFDGAIEHTLCCVGCPNLAHSSQNRDSPWDMSTRGRMISYGCLPDSASRYAMKCYHLFWMWSKAQTIVRLSVHRQYYLAQTAYASTGRHTNCCIIQICSDAINVFSHEKLSIIMRMRKRWIPGAFSSPISTWVRG